MEKFKVVRGEQGNYNIDEIYLNPENIVSAEEDHSIRQKLQEQHQQISQDHRFSRIVIEAGNQKKTYTVVGPPELFGGRSILHG